MIPHHQSASFFDLVRQQTPESLPRVSGEVDAPHGTTIVALVYADGVAMAGDRRATWGNQIAQRDIEKVFLADPLTCVGIAGTAGVATELIRLFQLELEHYEKIEGDMLSFDGKAHRLGGMIRANLDRAMQGLAALPLLAGWDGTQGRIVSYDVVGGRYPERDFHAVGSGASFARSSLKKLYRPDFDQRSAVVALVQALIDSSDEDAATAGPDVVRGIYPRVVSGGADGLRLWSDKELAGVVTEVMESRRRRPDGPGAPLL